MFFVSCILKDFYINTFWVWLTWVCFSLSAVSSIDDEQLGGGEATSETLVGRWNCSECTFANHPSLETCEICEMPRITMGNRIFASQTNMSPDLTDV